MYNSLKKTKGFSLIEVLLVISVFLILAGFGINSILNVRDSSSSTSTIYTLISDIKNQQTKAMSGDTEGRGTPDTYSVYIQSNKYTLFHGENYSASDSSNFSVSMPQDSLLSTTFSSNKIVFASGSGEIENFTSGQDTITLRNTVTNQQSVLQLNKYGVVVRTK